MTRMLLSLALGLASGFGSGCAVTGFVVTSSEDASLTLAGALNLARALEGSEVCGAPRPGHPWAARSMRVTRVTAAGLELVPVGGGGGGGPWVPFFLPCIPHFHCAAPRAASGVALVANLDSTAARRDPEGEPDLEVLPWHRVRQVRVRPWWALNVVSFFTLLFFCPSAYAMDLEDASGPLLIGAAPPGQMLRVTFPMWLVLSNRAYCRRIAQAIMFLSERQTRPAALRA